MGRKSKISIVLAVILAVAMALCGLQPTYALGDSTVSAPEHHKTIVDNEDGSYSITLDVKGKVTTETAPVDVILVFDRSTSMNGTVESTGSSRFDMAKETAVRLADKLFESYQDNADVPPRFAIVDFGTYATSEGTTWYEQEAEVDHAIDNIKAPSGSDSAEYTNWEDAWKAVEQASRGYRDEADKYIIFLSDGYPNLRDTYCGNDAPSSSPFNSSYAWYWGDTGSTTPGSGNLNRKPISQMSDSDGITYSYYGTGSNSPDSTDPQGYNLQMGAQAAASVIGASGATAIGVDVSGAAASASDNNMNKFGQLVNSQLANNNGTSGTFEASDYTSFASAINEITTTTATKSYKATIQDTLSGYVGFDQYGSTDASNSTFTVEVIDDEGNQVSTGADVTFSTDLDSDATVVYDPETGTVIYHPENGGTLKDNYTYKLTFTVWPNQLAYDREANIQYNIENNIDDDQGDTACGQDGADGSGVGVEGGNIYSNDNDNTLLTFDEVQTINGIEKTLHANQTADFEDPVVAVPTSSITVKKVWMGGSEDSVTVKLQWKVGEDWEDYTANDGSSAVAPRILSPENEWTATFDNLPAGPVGHEYRVVETDPDPSTGVWDVAYTYEVNNPDDEYEYNYESSVSDDGGGVLLKGLASQSATATTTNKKVFSLLVNKKGKTSGASDDSAVVLPGATFQLSEASIDGTTCAVTTSTQVGSKTSGEDGTLTFDKALVPGKTYLLEETEAPSGYEAADPYVLEVGYDGSVTRYKTTMSGSTITVDFSSAEMLSLVEDDPTTYTMTVTDLNFQLPSTGGHGVLPFVAGSFGVLGIGTILAKKRLSARENEG